MKPLWILFLLLLPIAPLAIGQTNQPPMMRGAKLHKPQSPVTRLVVGANALAGGVAEPGWPIIVSVAMAGDKPIPAGLNIKMTDDKDKAVAVAFEPVARPARTNEASQLYWIAAESATKTLSPGRYHITLVPAGDLQIESGDLRVKPANDSRADTLGLLRIQRALLLGKDDEALAEADRLNTEEAWIAKGDILMSKDLPDEALQAYDKALELHKKTDSEPLFILERRRAAFFRSLEKRGVLTPAQSQQPPPF